MRLSVDQKGFARQLRRGQTDAERRLWSRLRNRRLLGCKFRRQYPVGPYFADFACLELGLVVELDGGQHNTEHGRVHDAQRSAVLASHGMDVLRFWDNDVLLRTDAVVEVIRGKLTEKLPSPALRATSSAKRER